MARITVPDGDLPERYRLFGLQPAMGKALAGLSQAIYGQSIIGLRVREAVRMRIAQINQCQICLAYRFPEQAEQFAALKIDEDFYAAVADWRHSSLLDDREKLAVEYAERFATQYLALDGFFFERLHLYFTDAEIFDLTAVIAGLLANGRLMQVLQVEQGACAL